MDDDIACVRCVWQTVPRIFSGTYVPDTTGTSKPKENIGFRESGSSMTGSIISMEISSFRRSHGAFWLLTIVSRCGGRRKTTLSNELTGPRARKLLMRERHACNARLDMLNARERIAQSILTMTELRLNGVKVRITEMERVRVDGMGEKSARNAGQYGLWM